MSINDTIYNSNNNSNIISANEARTISEQSINIAVNDVFEKIKQAAASYESQNKVVIPQDTYASSTLKVIVSILKDKGYSLRITQSFITVSW